MMRQEDHEPVCIVNGCGRTRVHRVGECAPDDAPTYSDGAAVQALVDEALTGKLTAVERWSLVADIHAHGGSADDCDCEAVVQRIEEFIDARTSAAVKQAQADALRQAASAMRNGLPDYDPHRSGIAAFEPTHADWLDDRAAQIARGVDL